MDTPKFPVLQNISYACVRMDPVNVSAKFLIRIRSFSRSWDNSDCSFGVGLRTPNLGEGEAVGGRRWSRSKERLGLTSYRLSIVTFPLSLRVSEILPLLCSSMPLFPTPPLVSPKFLRVPLGVGGWLLGCEEWRCWVIVRAISFQDFQPTCMWSWSTHVTNRRTDGQTDGRTTCNLNTGYALVHRAVIMKTGCELTKLSLCNKKREWSFRWTSQRAAQISSRLHWK